MEAEVASASHIDEVVAGIIANALQVPVAAAKQGGAEKARARADEEAAATVLQAARRGKVVRAASTGA